MKIVSIDIKCKITVFSFQILSIAIFFDKITDDKYQDHGVSFNLFIAFFKIIHIFAVTNQISFQ
jgi:hypothetical protein